MTLVYTEITPSSLTYLQDFGAKKIPPTNDFEQARWVYKDAVFILYNSNKLVIQAKPEREEELNALCEKHGLCVQKHVSKQSSKKTNPQKFHPIIIGSDETLKGDTFGGFVVVGALFFSHEEDALRSLGVKDSKLLSDDQCLHISQHLLSEFPRRFSIKNLFPKEYNVLQQQQSLTGLLNRMHAQVGDELKQQEPTAFHVVDKYPGCNAGDAAFAKAESLYVQVAAASVVARAQAVQQFNELSARAGFILPKGSTYVKEALEKLNASGLKKADFVKLHFKNVN
jgi:ribonuclease HIII